MSTCDDEIKQTQQLPSADSLWEAV